MKISLTDRSLYYKGLMLLIRKDHEIRDEERSIMMRIGEMLGFESEFCQNAIDEIIDNKYITDSPPLFSKPNIARCFVRDGLRLSASDGNIHMAEIDWLESVAKNNGLSTLWAEEFKKICQENPFQNPENSLELKHFVWE